MHLFWGSENQFPGRISNELENRELKYCGCGYEEMRRDCVQFGK
jgi:hypothetical protein